MASASGKGKGKRKRIANDSEVGRRAKDALVDDMFELAVELYSEAIGMDPENGDLFADRAQAHIKLKKFTEAVADADKAIHLDASMAKAHVRRGIALSYLAKESLEAGASLDPALADARLSGLINACNELTAAPVHDHHHAGLPDSIPQTATIPPPVEINDENHELHEQIHRKLKTMKYRYQYRLVDLLKQTCCKLDKHGDVWHWVFLRKYLVNMLAFLNMKKGSIPLSYAERMDRIEGNIVKFLSTDVKFYRLSW